MKDLLKKIKNPILILGLLGIFAYAVYDNKKRLEIPQEEQSLKRYEWIYKRISDYKEEKDVHPEEASEEKSEYSNAEIKKLEKQADSIKNSLPPAYQLKADSIRRLILD